MYASIGPPVADIPSRHFIDPERTRVAVRLKPSGNQHTLSVVSPLSETPGAALVYCSTTPSAHLPRSMTASSPARTPGRGRGQGRDTDGFDDEDDCHLRDEDEREVLFVNDVGSFDDMDPEETARKRRRTDAIRYTSFACAILSWSVLSSSLPTNAS